MKQYIILVLSIVLFIHGCSDEDTAAYIVSDRTSLAITKSGIEENEINTTIEDNTSALIEESNATSDEPISVVRIVEDVNSIESKRENWYIRLVAENLSNGQVYSGARMGELEEDNASAVYSLKALNPFGGTYIDIVFEDDDAVMTGDYAVFFLRTNEKSMQKWRFTVRVSDPEAEILLQWRGIYMLEPYIDEVSRQRYEEKYIPDHTLWKHMKLIDTDTSEEIAVTAGDRLLSYRFKMNGQQERTFEWIVYDEEITTDDLKPLDNILQQDSSIEQSGSPLYTPVEFNLDHPPRIKDMGEE